MVELCRERRRPSQFLKRGTLSMGAEGNADCSIAEALAGWEETPSSRRWLCCRTVGSADAPIGDGVEGTAGPQP